MFDFYKMGFDEQYLSEADLHEAAKWNCITKEEFKQIVGKDYIS